MSNRSTQVKTMALAALMLALAYVLPFFTGNIPKFGAMLLPMHLPVLLCGFLCGAPWGAAVGLIAPLMRSFLAGMPPLFPTAVAMAFELAGYGFMTGFLYKRLPKNLPGIYISLVSAMLFGRVLWGIVRALLTLAGNNTFSFAVFIADGFTSAIPGIVLQLIVIPVLLTALQRTGLIPRAA